MTLIRLTQADRAETKIYVNPEHVVALTPYQTDKTVVITTAVNGSSSAFMLTVLGDPDKIARTLGDVAS